MTYTAECLRQLGVTMDSLEKRISDQPREQAIICVEVLAALGVSPKDFAERQGRAWAIDDTFVWQADQTSHPGVVLKGPALILEPNKEEA